MIHQDNSAYRSREGRNDQALRTQLFAAAQGDDLEAALAALDSLRRIYRLRLPLVEARLGIAAHDLNGHHG